MEVEEENPWSGILAATMFAIRSTVHTTSQYTPMQLVFGRDSILNVAHTANWKQRLIRQNNILENRKHIPYQYKVGEQVLIKQDQQAKYANILYKGPYTVTAVNNNGMVQVDMGIVSDTYNIRRIHPYRRKDPPKRNR